MEDPGDTLSNAQDLVQEKLTKAKDFVNNTSIGDAGRASLKYATSHIGKVIIVSIITLFFTILYFVLCYFFGKQTKISNSPVPTYNSAGIPNTEPSQSIFNKFPSFRHKPTLTVIIPAALNGADFAAVDQQQHIFVYKHTESLPGVLTEIKSKSSPLALLVINPGSGSSPYGFLVPTINGIPVTALDGTSLNNVSCNVQWGCGSLSLQGVFTNEQLKILGSYTGALPTYNNGTAIVPNTTQTHRATSHWG
jgi:hypothetical protein